VYNGDKVEPDAYMQKLTHFIVWKKWQQNFCGGNLGASPTQLSGHGGDLGAIAPMASSPMVME